MKSTYLSVVIFIFYAVWSIIVIKEDLTYKKISNKKLLLGIVIALLGFGIMAINTIIGIKGHSMDYLKPLFYNLSLYHLLWSIFAGLILWYGEIWPAGDAKFFIITSLFIPLINPFIKGFPDHLFLLFLVSIFVISAIYVLVNATYLSYVTYGSKKIQEPLTSDGIIKKSFRFIFKKLKEFNFKSIFQFLVPYIINLGMLFLIQQTMAYIWTTNILQHIVKRVDIIYFFLFFLWNKINKFFKDRKVMYVSLSTYAVYLVIGNLFFPEKLREIIENTLYTTLTFIIILTVGKFLLESSSEGRNKYWVGVQDLKPNIVLTSDTIEVLRSNPVFQGAFDICFKDGLTEEQVDVLKEWLPRLPDPDAKLEAVSGKSFSEWIFIGALFLLLFGNSVIDILK
jgi:hypothetical protein